MQSSDKINYLSELLTCAGAPPEDAKRVLSAFTTPADIACAGQDILKNISGCSPETAELLNLVSTLSSRRVTDEFKPGRKYTTEEIKRYVCALLFHLSVECVYMISFNSSGRFIAADLITEGTINSSAFLPRKMADIALKRRASSVILAHNQPSGNPLPSDNDLTVTVLAESVLRDAHVKLEAHYINVGFLIHDCLLDAKIMDERSKSVSKIEPIN